MSKGLNTDGAGSRATTTEDTMSVTRESVRRDRFVGAFDQEAVNAAELSLSDLRALAERRSNADRFPQYRGAFDRHERVRVTRDVKTKAGLAFARGDVSLGVWEDPGEDRPRGGWVVFSFRNGVATSVLGHAERVDG